MEIVVSIEFLRGRNDEIVAKELAVVSKKIIQTYHFKRPYNNYFSDDNSNGISWDEGFLAYKLFTVLSEVTSNFAHVYSLGTSTCQLLKDLLHIPINDLDTYVPRHSHAKFEIKMLHYVSQKYLRYSLCCKTRTCHIQLVGIPH
jgi:hypothetical protein